MVKVIGNPPYQGGNRGSVSRKPVARNEMESGYEKRIRKSKRPFFLRKEN